MKYILLLGLLLTGSYAIAENSSSEIEETVYTYYGNINAEDTIQITLPDGTFFRISLYKGALETNYPVINKRACSLEKFKQLKF